MKAKFLQYAHYVLYVVVLLGFFFQTAEAKGNIFTGYIITTCIMVLLMVCTFITIREYGIRNVHSLAIIALTIGQVLKMVWGSIFILGQVQDNKLQIFSLINIMGLAAYLLMFYGLVIELRQSKAAWSAKKIFTNIALGIAMSAILIYFSVFRIGLASLDSVTIVAIFSDLLLGVFAIMIFALVREYRKGKMAIAWTFILFSFLVSIVADITIANVYDLYVQRVWPYRNFDFLWSLSFLLFSHGIYRMKVIIDEVSASLLRKNDA